MKQPCKCGRYWEARFGSSRYGYRPTCAPCGQLASKCTCEPVARTICAQPSPEYVSEVLAEVDRRNQQRLKPCKDCTPLIGNGVLLTLFHMTESDIGGYYPASVMCEQCHKQIWGAKTDESAIKAWNKAQGNKHE